MDGMKGFGRKNQHTTKLFFDRILDYGLEDCVPSRTQTFRHSYGKFEWQLDHMFASPKLKRKLTGLTVGNSPEVAAISDHNPIVADFSS